MTIRLFVLISILVLMACSNSSTIITGQISEAVETTDVKVYYSDQPGCEFDVVAHLEISGDYYDKGKLIKAFQKEAAELGASAVQVLHVQKLGATEYMGSARAIYCTN